jgi:hypothetical protein
MSTAPRLRVRFLPDFFATFVFFCSSCLAACRFPLSALVSLCAPAPLCEIPAAGLPGLPIQPRQLFSKFRAKSPDLAPGFRAIFQWTYGRALPRAALEQRPPASQPRWPIFITKIPAEGS